MSNQTIYLLVALALIAVLILFGVNLMSRYQTTAPAAANAQTTAPTIGNQQLKIDRAQVKGISVEKEGKVYNLSMKQQVQALSFLDRAEPVDKKDYPTKNDAMGFNRLIIYRFNQPDLSLTPFTYENKNIVFESSLIKGSYIMEMSGGEFNNLIQKVVEQ